jgi:protoporphyrinogen oxidase
MDGLVILGAGLAGLGCALEAPGSRIYEAKPHVGGHAASHDLGGVSFDEGAHICHSKDPEFLELIGRSTVPHVSIAPSVVRNSWCGSWVGYPVQNHLHELPIDLRIKALSDLVQAFAAPSADAPANYRQWCLRQYGPTLTHEFYERFTSKYWRVAMEDLATDWLGGRLLPSQLERVIEGAFRAPSDGQAVFTTFRYPQRGGFFGFFADMYRGLPLQLNQRAVEIDALGRTITFASGIRKSYEAMASSIPLPELVRITKDIPGRLQELAKGLRHTQLLCVNLLVNRPQLTDCHWFYVYDEAIDASRVSVPSNLSPTSALDGVTALQAEIFRRDDEPLEVEALTERTVNQLAALLNFDPGRDVMNVAAVPVRYSYVISDHRRASIVQELCEWFEARRIFPMGLYGRWKYIWSDAALLDGRRTARRISGRELKSCAA